VLSLAISLVAFRRKAPWWLAATIAVGVTCTAEIALKVAEYFVKDTFHTTAYYDSLVDNTSTLAGALAGAAVGVFLATRSRRFRQP
jgi:hypothetical protein